VGGVSIDDCVEMTHAIDGPLDELDPIKDAYTLEVSSPGAERALTRDEHFEKYIGSKVMVKLIRPLDGKREFKGILKGYDKGDVTVETDDTSFVFNKKEASYVKLDDFDDYIAE
jgi:ribosome maturation factor RimP